MEHSLPVPIKRKKMLTALKAYAEYMQTHPTSRLKFDAFQSIYAALASTKQNPKFIARTLGVDGATIANIDKEFKIRSEKERDEITRAAKARGKTLEEVVSKEYIAETQRLIKNTEMSFTEIGNLLRKKYGRGDRHTVAQINEQAKIRSAKKIQRLGGKKAAQNSKVVSDERFEQVLLTKERVNGKTRFKYTLSDISRILKLSTAGVHARWKRNYRTQRTPKANNEVAKRKRGENIGKAKRSNALVVAINLLNNSLAPEEDIIEAMKRSDRETGKRIVEGIRKGQQRTNRHYRDLLRRANEKTGILGTAAQAKAQNIPPNKKSLEALRGISNEEKISRLLISGWGVKDIAKALRISLKEVQKIRSIRRVVFEHLQKAGAWIINSAKQRKFSQSLRTFTTNSLAKTFRTKEEWELAVRMTRRYKQPNVIGYRALLSLSSAIRAQGGYAPNEKTQKQRPTKPIIKIEEKPTPTHAKLIELMSTPEGREKAIILVSNSNRPDSIKQGLLARIAEHSQKQPKPRRTIRK